MPETKRFPLRTLLSVTTGRLLTKPTKDGNGIGDLYKILGWMTNDSPFTHQLPRFMVECKPWLLRWFPELEQASNELDWLGKNIKQHGPEAGCETWLGGFAGIMQAEYDVPRIPADDHETKDPVDELVSMRGTDEGVVVVQS